MPGRTDRQSDRVDDVLNRHPAYVLLARTHSAAHAHFERRQELCQHTAFTREDWPEPQVDSPHACLNSDLSRLLPFATDSGEKAAAGITLFIQNLVATIAIDAGS